MEIINNDFTVTFTNAAAAKKAKLIAEESFRAQHYDLYAYQPSILAADSLIIENDMTLTFEEYCFDSSDLMDACINVVKAIANSMKSENFEFSVEGCDTYTESSVEGSFSNGTLTINSIFYPSGWIEDLECPECGEPVVSLEDYDPSKTYVCPECGEEIDLSVQYEEVAPVVSKEVITMA